MRAFLLLYVIILIIALNASAQNYYYVCSYAHPEWGTNILFSKIDLDKKEIVFSKEIPITGYISLNAPIQIKHENNEYFFISTVYGLTGHNSPAGKWYAYFALINEFGEIIQIDSLPNSYFFESIDSIDAGVLLDYIGKEHIIADLSINDEMKIEINKISVKDYSDELYPIIGGFRYFKKISDTNNRIFWDLEKQGEYILIIDTAESKLIDSLNISSELDYSKLFALSKDDSTIYIFYIDCFCEGWRNPTKLESLAPSYLKRFSAKDLSFIDSLYIPSPCTDSICFEQIWESCDIAGNYIVYFCMQTAHPEWYPPALLLIFDTRTNEATWLRVGWR
ncbi:MAG: hypothetical protein JSW64_09695 [Candidatus Zixiibacteriota bacterium]|nr:MAG: hypothetical protein JSW64_09695 [candidate division Zixibacteria bacterium]